MREIDGRLVELFLTTGLGLGRSHILSSKSERNWPSPDSTKKRRKATLGRTHGKPATKESDKPDWLPPLRCLFSATPLHLRRSPPSPDRGSASSHSSSSTSTRLVSSYSHTALHSFLLLAPDPGAGSSTCVVKSSSAVGVGFLVGGRGSNYPSATLSIDEAFSRVS